MIFLFIRDLSQYPYFDGYRSNCCLHAEEQRYILFSLISDMYSAVFSSTFILQTGSLAIYTYLMAYQDIQPQAFTNVKTLEKDGQTTCTLWIVMRSLSPINVLNVSNKGLSFFVHLLVRSSWFDLSLILPKALPIFICYQIHPHPTKL